MSLTRGFLRSLTGALLALALAWAGGASAGEEAPAEKQAAKKIVERHKDAVVLVEAVVKMKISAGGRTQDREQKMEANGTVITPEGLTVVSNGSIDPSAQLARLGAKADISTSDVKIITADGTEHEAELVLTDKDLDLAFFRPKGQLKLPHLELKKAGEPALLDTLVSITRLGRKANREPGVALSEVLSVIKKPRTRYVTSGQVFQGCPVFNVSGEVLGLALVQTDGAVNISVLPCEDILEAARQVGQKKEAEKDKPEAKPKTEEKPAAKQAATD
jgi:S1-C subfamily serine protease